MRYMVSAAPVTRKTASMVRREFYPAHGRPNPTNGPVERLEDMPEEKVWEMIERYGQVSIRLAK